MIPVTVSAMLLPDEMLICRLEYPLHGIYRQRILKILMEVLLMINRNLASHFTLAVQYLCLVSGIFIPMSDAN